MRPPSQKEWSAGVAGLVVWLLLVVLKHFWNIEVPADLEGLLIGGVTIAIAKIVPLTNQDILNRLNDDVVHAGVILGKVDPIYVSPAGDIAPASPETQKLVDKATKATT